MNFKQFDFNQIQTFQTFDLIKKNPPKHKFNDALTPKKRLQDFDEKTVDPLAFWRENEHKYPNIAKLAKKYLCVQATSVASERVFSTAGDVVHAERSRLDQEQVDALIFLKKNI